MPPDRPPPSNFPSYSSPLFVPAPNYLCVKLCHRRNSSSRLRKNLLWHSGDSMARTFRATGKYRRRIAKRDTRDWRERRATQNQDCTSRLSRSACSSRASETGGLFQHSDSIHPLYTTVTRARKSMSSAVCRRIASRSFRAAACSKAAPIILMASNPYPPPSPFMR